MTGMTYHIREATLGDAEVLVRHRIAMFTDMGLAFDAAPIDRLFRAWLAAHMPAGVYHAWLVETDDGEIAAGGGLSVLPWPPGPQYAGDRIAVVYNVYTEPAHRRRGLRAASHGGDSRLVPRRGDRLDRAQREPGRPAALRVDGVSVAVEPDDVLCVCRRV